MCAFSLFDYPHAHPLAPYEPSSQFSLTNLSPTDPLRRIAASKVRSQAAAIPTVIQPRPRYPHNFRNAEGIPLRHNLPPLIEHPLTPGGPW